jgi:hypothetical protein
MIPARGWLVVAIWAALLALLYIAPVRAVEKPSELASVLHLRGHPRYRIVEGLGRVGEARKGGRGNTCSDRTGAQTPIAMMSLGAAMILGGFFL